MKSSLTATGGKNDSEEYQAVNFMSANMKFDGLDVNSYLVL